jgi:hypothetical protein
VYFIHRRAGNPSSQMSFQGDFRALLNKHVYVFSAIGRLVVKIFAGCYFPLASGKMTR